MNQWITESLGRLTNESMNQWSKEPTNEATKQWINEPLKSVNQWVHGWMKGWMDGWVSYFFVERLLHWATSLLMHLFSQLLLLWAASALAQHQLCALFRASLRTSFFCRHRGPEPRKQRPYFRDRWSHTSSCKNARGFAPEVFTREFPAPGLFHFTTTWWSAWHDDVIDMMVWMLRMTIVRDPEVCQLKFLCGQVGVQPLK